MQMSKAKYSSRESNSVFRQRGVDADLALLQLHIHIMNIVHHAAFIWDAKARRGARDALCDVDVPRQRLAKTLNACHTAKKASGSCGQMIAHSRATG